MKIKKRSLFAILLSVLFLFPSLPAYAHETAGSASLSAEGSLTLTNTEIVELTYEEYVELSAKILGISKEEFMQTNPDKQTRSTETVYKQATYTYTYTSNPVFSASLVAVFRLEGYGNYFDIVSCSGVYTKKNTGTGNYSWVQGFARCESLSASQATLVASGYFETATTSSGGMAGFGLSHSIGETYYYTSDALPMQKTVTAYELKTAQSA